MAKPSNFYPVILAGGRGTRFWPLSRRRCAKQLLPLDGKKTMIQQTVARLLPMAKPSKFWIVTNEDLRAEIAKQLPGLAKGQSLAEPVGRNTAPAIGLAAFLQLREDPTAVLGLFPSDHVIDDEKRYREWYAFPGFGLNEISGRSFTRHLLEANLPPYVFESAGAPAFHLAWLRPALFASTLWTEPSDPAIRTRYGNIGAQLDLRFSVLHWYEMTRSVGAAAGLRGSERAGHEYMVSLKIM